MLHNSTGCNCNLIPTIRSKGNDAYSVMMQATRRKNLETGLNSTHSLVHLQKQRLHYCTSTFYKRPAPSWRVSSIGRALHRYRRGQGFESRTSLNFFRLSFRNCKSCVYNYDDLLSYNTSTNSQTTTPKLSTGQNLMGVATV